MVGESGAAGTSGVVGDDILDAVIVGGGPAGSAAARLLALWGHSVALLTRPPTGHPPLAESVPPSTRKLFNLLGVAQKIDEAGFFPARGNLVRWGDAPLRRADFAPGAVGYHVVRDAFDSLLLDLAEEAGALVLRDATVRRVDRAGVGGDGEGERRRVEYEDGRGGMATLEARFVLDCSGRSGVIASPDLRVHDQANATVALAGVWRTGPEASPAEPYTLVESYRDGWAWSMPVSDTHRYM